MNWEELSWYAGWSDPDGLATPTRINGVFSYKHPSAIIGERTILCPFSYVGPDVEIGEDCFIGPGTVVGGPGFGYEEDPEDEFRWVYRPHEFGVRIHDRVHIGSNATIDRGRWRHTIIAADSKIDNLVHIAHNVIIGRACIIVAHAEISGSVKVGARTWIGPHVSTKDNIEIGANSLIGVGAAVVNDVPSNEVWAGVPARKIRDNV